MAGARPSKKLKTSINTYTPAAKVFLGTFKNKKKPQDKEPSAAATTSGATVAAARSPKTAVPEAADSRASRFDAFDPPLSVATLEALEAHGFQTATPVQEATIPRLLRHQDVAVQACTGSGKTLAFLIPLVELLHRREDPLRKHQVGALIIEPTRELAVQVHTVLLQLATRWPQLSVALMVGGTNVGADMAAWRERGGHVLVGTPGRLDDLMVRLGGEMLLRELELLVLDEADRLLDMGFEATLNSILQRLPKQRRTGLFSATQTGELLQLVRAGLRNPVKVEVKVRLLHAGGGGGGESGGDGRPAAAGPRKTSATPSSLSLFYMLCEEEQRLPQLLHFLAQKLAAGQKIMCYFLTCAQVDFFRSALPLLPHLKDAAMGALHGKMAPSNRLKAYEWFVAQKGGALLLCTDVAARGLDIPDVDWIVQYDAPQEPNAFVHRVGRTARMGRQGQALLLLRPHEETYTRFLELRKVPLQPMEPVAGLPSLHGQLQPLLLADRAIMEKANAAYVSMVRAYSEHECKYIFQLAQLDLGALASALALLRLPKLKELRKMHKKGVWVDFTPCAAVTDLSSIRYKDKQREKQRQQNLRKQAAEVAEAAAVAAAVAAEGGPAAEPVSAKEAARRRQREREEELAEHDEDDEEDLAREASLLKKLKRKQISEAEFNRRMGIGGGDDDDDSGDDGDDDGGDDDGDGGEPEEVGTKSKQPGGKTKQQQVEEALAWRKPVPQSGFRGRAQAGIEAAKPRKRQSGQSKAITKRSRPSQGNANKGKR